MQSIHYHIFRRMRIPLLILLMAYAISIFGMTQIPGVDDQGNTWYMSFFHAFYYVSFMATTIGFGEIPYPFSDAQRLWGIFSIYLTVIAWFYAIGAILNLLQDKAFKRAFEEIRFSRSLKLMGEPFYLICGFGDTGTVLVRALTERGIRAVVLDANEQAITRLKLKNYLVDVPALQADVTMPENLKLAGIQTGQCAGVVAMTDSDAVNLKVAITSKLLNPELAVICRGETPDYEENMASFGTDYIIDPYITFANRLSLALERPGVYTLYDWLAGIPRHPLPDPLFPPHGKWVLCGYGRFGQAMHARLTEQSLPVVTVEVDPEGTNSPPGSIRGWGTDHDTLRQAGIESAVGLVAGTEDDTNNLSIVMTALEMNPNLFVIIRQNRRMNSELFSLVGAQLVMESSAILAREVRLLLTLPLVRAFLSEAERMDNDWANQVVSRILGIAGEHVPDIWDLLIDGDHAPAVHLHLMRGESVRIEHLLRDPTHREVKLPILPLFLQRRDGACLLMPPESCPILPGDRLLFCAEHGVQRRMLWTRDNDAVLHYVMTGEDLADSSIWRWLQHRFPSLLPGGRDEL
uniref:Putative Kef-type K+ transport systems, predicted NAD-binding component n=1 Tax=Magnetococcus massalia (strain MO-1) TaxID=451514 RepID=A0A1S7LJE0_MAGMO|nr:Putative Kef-type K+ transport systems, predicted NAD-binding component [Candidatus Magnetococcus massalia]